MTTKPIAFAAPEPATKSPQSIAAVVRRYGNRVSVEWDMAEAAAALDDECARLRERVAEVERERDEVLAQLAALPIGPAKDAPDEVGWWLMVTINPYWIRDSGAQYVCAGDVGSALGCTWYRFKVQP